MGLRQHIIRIALCLTIALAFAAHVAGVVNFPLIERLEDLSYDTRLRLTVPGGVDPRIVIIDIDEDSLRKEGHWPWSRLKLKALVDNLFEKYGIAVLGFDVVFAEREETLIVEQIGQLGERDGDEGFVTRLRDYAGQLNPDQLLASAVGAHPVVLGYYFNTDPTKRESSGMLPQPTFEDEDITRSIYAPQASSFGGNLPVLQENAVGGGFFSTPLIDDDGIIRRVPLLHAFEGNLYESFGLAVARVYLDDIVLPLFAEGVEVQGYPAMEAIELAGQRIPIDADSGVLVPYRGPPHSFPYVSASDVLRDSVPDPTVLQGAIALVGTSAAGLVDLRATPIETVFPGVEVHANVVAAILDGGFKEKAAYTRGAELAYIGIVGFFVAVVLPLVNPVLAAVLAAVVLAATVAFNFYLWQQDVVLPLAASLMLVVTLFGVNAAYGFSVEARSKRLLRQAFSTYLAPALVEQLADNPRKLRLQGEMRVMTFLFTDIAGFTSFAERIEPELLVKVLNEYLDGMCGIVMDHGGTIDKIVGDAVHGIFNAPLEQPDHADRAVACALALDEFSTEFIERQEQAGVKFGVTRVGVNTGPAVVGNFGGSRRFDYTAHGDAINTAARMESVNKHLGTRICVAASTVELCPEHHFRPIAGLVLKGKTEAVEAYEPISAEVAASKRIKDYLEAYALMRAESPQALQALESLAETYPDDPVVAMHMQRLRDGEKGTVIVMAEK